MSCIHFLQLLAVKLQLFSSNNFRYQSIKCLAATQFIFMVLMPFLTIAIQIAWLYYEQVNNYDSVYYKWMITDVFLNFIGSIAYLTQLERIGFE